MILNMLPLRFIPLSLLDRLPGFSFSPELDMDEVDIVRVRVVLSTWDGLRPSPDALDTGLAEVALVEEMTEPDKALGETSIPCRPGVCVGIGIV